VGLYILHRLGCNCYMISIFFWRYYGSKNCKNQPPYQFGELLVRLYPPGNVLHPRLIATYTKVFVYQLVRKISTDKLFRTQKDRHTHRDKQTHSHTHTCQAKNEFSWSLSSVSRTRKCAYIVSSTSDFHRLVFQYFHSFYEHGNNRMKIIIIIKLFITCFLLWYSHLWYLLWYSNW